MVEIRGGMVPLTQDIWSRVFRSKIGLCTFSHLLSKHFKGPSNVSNSRLSSFTYGISIFDMGCYKGFFYTNFFLFLLFIPDNSSFFVKEKVGELFPSVVETLQWMLLHTATTPGP